MVYSHIMQFKDMNTYKNSDLIRLNKSRWYPNSTVCVWDNLSDSIDDVYSQTFDFLVKSGFGKTDHGPNPLVISFNLNRIDTIGPNKS